MKFDYSIYDLISCMKIVSSTVIDYIYFTEMNELVKVFGSFLT
jgi:hypothetical protein